MSPNLPSGVVTFLFTDVEGSTNLLHELGDAYADALHEHRRLLRAAITAHDGVEVDTQGDAFFVAFARASDAVAAAETGQRALLSGPIRVRMGLHTGEPRLTTEGYVGLDLHRGARIAAAGHGGQVLLSQSTAALVDAPVRDLGPHRLKDLTVPERVYQLEADGLASDFPLLRTLDAGGQNLPFPRTSFVGRDDELEAIERLLEDTGCRLLTLLGPGGVGKTRLAIEAATRRVGKHPHGVHFVPLAPVASPDFLVPTIAETLGFTIDPAHSAFPPEQQLLDYLSERSMLLVLDNFEHLIAGSGLLTQILERAEHARLLATSRERLNLQGEWLVEVEGLEVATNGGAADHAALRLFTDRARQSDPNFTLRDDQRAHAARICRLVEGMPLGIELAAAWVSMLPPSELADEIENNLDLLSTSMRDLPERHRSLRAAFDQSWRLLTDEQRGVFARLSVIRGSFTRQAATVAGATLPMLSSLTGKSLVRPVELGRFELHELLRQYAAEQLARAPRDLEDARERHARHYLGLLLERSDALQGPGIAEARDEIRAELTNLRVAAEWAVTRWADDEVVRVLSILSRFYDQHSWQEGGEAFHRLVEIARDARGGARHDSGGGARHDAPAPSAVLASARAQLAYQQSVLGASEQAEEAAQAALPALRKLGLDSELAVCLLALGITALYRDQYEESIGRLTAAEAAARTAGDAFFLVEIVAWRGWADVMRGDLAAAREALGESHAAAMELGNPRHIGFTLSKLGVLADAQGDFADAMRRHMEGERAFERIGDRGGQGYALTRASLSAHGLGDHAEAMRLARAGYDAFTEIHHRWGVISALCRMGFSALALGDVDEAREHLHRGLEMARESGATSLVLHALSGIGVLLARHGESQRAAEILSFALRHPGHPAAYRFVVEPELERLQGSLPAEDFAAAQDAAAALDLDAALAAVGQSG